MYVYMQFPRNNLINNGTFKKYVFPKKKKKKFKKKPVTQEIYSPTTLFKINNSYVGFNKYKKKLFNLLTILTLNTIGYRLFLPTSFIVRLSADNIQQVDI